MNSSIRLGGRKKPLFIGICDASTFWESDFDTLLIHDA